jgi:uncharacterized protein (DUF885 family)
VKSLSAAILAATLFVAACSGGQDQAEPAATEGSVDASAQMAALFDEQFERNLELNPLSATAIGDDRYDDRMAISASQEYRDADKAMDEEFLARLLEIDRDALSYQEQLSYDIFRIRREQSLEGNQFPFHLQPMNQFRLMTNFFVQLGSGKSMHPFKTVKNYDDFLSRADDILTNGEVSMDNMREGMRAGVVQPKVLMAKVVPQIQAHIVETAEESNFWMPIENMPEDFSDEDRERLTAAYKDAIENKYVPAFERLNNFIGDDYIEAARDTVGLGDQPNGKAWYEYMVKLRTTTDMTPEEIHQIGLDEVARIHGEMRGVMEEVGFEGDLKDFFEYTMSDDQFFYDEPDDMIQGYRDMSANIEELSKKIFDISPKTDFEVRKVEAFREASASGGSYSSGTPDGSRPGIFYANTYDIKARPKWAMENLYLHEAIPGHHFQISLQRENEDLPQFRRFGGFTAYSEGWGLYAETLGKEIGVYEDPYSYFGSLNAELWRSIRLVVDTGLHAKGWSRQDVLDYMYANSAVAPARAISEAERFMAIPGQALAYKIGQLKIREIRNKAEARLGDSFDVTAFHREILQDGPMPLSMLESKLDRWVDAQL